MPKGRPAKPTSRKRLTGNPGKRALPAEAPDPQGKARCPEWLDDYAKREWQRIAPELERLGLLTLIDRAALASYCQAWAEFREATTTLREEGRTFTTEAGYMAPHPAIAQLRSAWATIKSFASIFGLDPTSRSKLGIKPNAQKEETVAARKRT